jgi:hypothetical protein
MAWAGVKLGYALWQEDALTPQDDGRPIEAVLDLPIRYIDRSRAYYLALGYDNPYRWAHNQDAPFAALSKPLSNSRVALVTTAAPFKPEAGDQGPRAPYNAAAKFTEVYGMAIEPAPDLRISHVGYDRKHTSAEDINTYFPLQRLTAHQRTRCARDPGDVP